ncbi:MAG: hypothetical protein A3K19_31925 [Lentisphaerae bacterium RIFOXYB12_FULL_65_16]|nr:MAG: hypothetical protein A3K18_10705 [Lentisphaerae bacterium RIFOXYA12_64_32]OGV88710.1 MAG: hypothetical protein A3K19_31925 [Lentisphaerae bacterium RIFOXYB12_FULL_65_16]
MGQARKREDRTWDLEERLLEYSAEVVKLTEKLPKTRAGNHVGGQLLRSGTSSYLNHGEAEGAESRRDFVHKMGVCLKELRESLRALRLIERVPLMDPPSAVRPLLQETDELIRIFRTSIRTAQAKLDRGDDDSHEADRS